MQNIRPRNTGGLEEPNRLNQKPRRELAVRDICSSRVAFSELARSGTNEASAAKFSASVIPHL